MKGAVLKLRLESHTANTSSWYARTQKTHKFLSRESVIAATTNTDWIVQETETDYDPDFVYGDHPKFYATPAMPEDISIRKYEVGSRMKEDVDETPQEHLLAYGHRELILPGSIFRAIVWGNYPEIAEGDICLIGKERAEAVIEEFNEHEIEEVDKPGKVHDIEIFNHLMRDREKSEKDIFVESGGEILRETAHTERYSIITGDSEKFLKIGEWCIPAIEGVTTDESDNT